MSTQKKKDFIINCLFFGLIIVIIFLFFKYVFSLIAPFVIAFFLAAILQKPIDFMCMKIPKSNKAVGIIITIICLVIVCALVFALGYLAVVGVTRFAINVPNVYENIEPRIYTVVNNASDIIKEWFPNIDRNDLNLALMEFGDSFKDTLMSSSSSVLTFVGSKVSGVPSFIFSLLICVIASFFMVGNYDKIKLFLINLLPEKYRQKTVDIWSGFGITLKKMIKAYALILFTTFVEVSLGLSILRVDNAFIIAFIIALVDIFPVLGTGTIVIPWAIISLLSGDTRLGLGLIIMYISITILRQILEPKIVSGRIGLNPIITLMCMYIGAKTIGILGMILLPMIAVLVVDSYKSSFKES